MKPFNVIIFCFTLVVGFPDEDDSTKDEKTVSGEMAMEGQFPYQAMITTHKETCGGSIISRNVILSAAHCFENTSPDDVKVYLGSIRVLSGDTYLVDEIITHESYFSKGTVVRNDVAILKLKSDIAFKENIQKIDLETREVGDVDAVVTGWGPINFEGSVPTNRLQHFTAKTISLEKCRRAFYGQDSINDRVICTETNLGGSCTGDSGSPLVSNDKQIGIVSYHVGLAKLKCYSNFPRVYAKVSSYLDWIEKHVKQWE